MGLKKGDFVELDYTGIITDENLIFDTTIQKTAEQAGLLHKHEPGQDHDHSDQYSPIIACIGENHILSGLDKNIEGKGLGMHKIQLKEIEAFGKKDAKLITMIPMSSFKKQNIQPYVGLDLNIDGKIGVVRSVGGGRVMVDFNHPLAGRDITYEVNLKRIITDGKEKVKALLKMARLPYKSLAVNGDKAEISLEQEIPEQYLTFLSEDIKRLTGLSAEYKKSQTDTKEEKQQESNPESEVGDKDSNDENKDTKKLKTVKKEPKKGKA